MDNRAFRVAAIFEPNRCPNLPDHETWGARNCGPGNSSGATSALVPVRAERLHAIPETLYNLPSTTGSTSAVAWAGPAKTWARLKPVQVGGRFGHHGAGVAGWDGFISTHRQLTRPPGASPS